MFSRLSAYGRNVLALLCLTGLGPAARAGMDLNNNQQSDIWELRYGVTGLVGTADADGDRVSNAGESIAGTDPLSAASVPEILPGAQASQWQSVTGKTYHVQALNDLATGTWSTIATYPGNNGWLSHALGAVTNDAMRRLQIQDTDTDGDQLTDWEELQVQFDPRSAHSARFDQTDLVRLTPALTNTNSVVFCTVVDAGLYERWPDPGVIAVRRTGGLRPLTVNISLGGSATRETDYTTAPGNTVTFPMGVSEVWLEFRPVADALDGEGDETIQLTLLAGPGYTLTSNTTASLTLGNETAASLPNPKAAARFLIQAAFGPDQDDTNDVDLVPENVEEVMAMGFEAWIDDQFTRPIGFIQPFTEYAPANISQFYTDPKSASWWNRAMGVPSLIPGGPAQLPDPLRQRMTFALSQIVVVSDRPETLAVEPDGVANFYDMLMTNAFENYRDVLFDTAIHPVMGFYLSHLMNRKADPVNNIFPDENFAREIMQLFSIGLWELNQDGTRRLDLNSQPIPTYDNGDITEFARVFTGLSYGPDSNTSFGNAPQEFELPMKAWDAYHDCDAKTLLHGATLPARTPSVPDTGTATMLDINAGIDNLFTHTNCAPFICRQLIQRFVTSNPSTGYIARVTAKFNNNGSGVRGDLKAVLKAVLLDTEARDPAMLSDPTFGKQREPFLRVVNLARAFNAAAQSGFYALDQFFMDHYEEPMKSPSVFNFYLPGYLPPGPLANAGLVGPEFQVVNAGSAISAPNYYLNAIRYDLHRWGSGDATRAVRLNLAPEMALVLDVNTMIRRIDLALTGGTLSPSEFGAIRDAVERIPTWIWEWDKERVWLAVYLVVTSPEFCVMR